MTLRGQTPHGTRNRYALGCRCPGCRAAASAYVRARRAAQPKRTAAKPGPKSDPSVWRNVRSIEPGLIRAACWCDQGFVGVTPAEVRAGQTRSCGRPGCAETVMA